MSKVAWVVRHIFWLLVGIGIGCMSEKFFGSTITNFILVFGCTFFAWLLLTNRKPKTRRLDPNKYESIRDRHGV